MRTLRDHLDPGFSKSRTIRDAMAFTVVSMLSRKTWVRINARLFLLGRSWLLDLLEEFDGRS